MNEDPRFDPERRRFLGTAVATAAAIPGVAALTSAALASPEALAQETPTAPAPPQAPGGPAPSALAKHLTAAMKERFGSAFPQARTDEIAQGIESTLQAVASLGAVKLENGEEPAFVFSAVKP